MAGRALHAYLSDEAHDGWHELAAHAGCSVSALIEVLGQRWLALHDDGAIGEAVDVTLLEQARRVDVGRRRRKGS